MPIQDQDLSDRLFAMVAQMSEAKPSPAQVEAHSKLMELVAELDWKMVEENLEAHKAKAMRVYFGQNLELWKKILGQDFMTAMPEDKLKVLKKVNSFIKDELDLPLELVLDGNGMLLVQPVVPPESKSKKS